MRSSALMTILLTTCGGRPDAARRETRESSATSFAGDLVRTARRLFSGYSERCLVNMLPIHRFRRLRSTTGTPFLTTLRRCMASAYLAQVALKAFEFGEFEERLARIES